MSGRAYLHNPAWIELSILRRNIATARALDGSLPLLGMLDASTPAMLSAGFTHDEIDALDADNARLLAQYPPRTAQQVEDDNRATDAEKASQYAEGAA